MASTNGLLVINVTECSIRVTVLLEYLDLAFATRSWLWNHNSVTTARTFYHDYQLYTDFQLIALSGLPGRREN